MDGLGTDGHPSRGGFLPPAQDRNRMWAGGRVEFRQPLKVGVPAERVSTVAEVKEKTGRTGALLFVTVRHEYHQAGEIVILEEQDIVYRQPSPPKLAGSEPAPQAQWRDTVNPTSVLLFRYSAVTFNGHRIHYDHPYVTGTEGYPGLVVHGPLIATEMVAAFTRAHPKARLTHLSYRGLRPLISPALLQDELPVSPAIQTLVEDSRTQIADVLHGRDDRLLIVVGPCSIHDHGQAMEYARQLRAAVDQHKKDLLIVMRVYFEKPRTTLPHQ
ncbi:hypothetical protein G6F35_014738 [Rhizopus arrhizus]|nr:hypothetical protein G6F35_014738 [Rhizopus arrhizus]